MVRLKVSQKTFIIKKDRFVKKGQRFKGSKGQRDKGTKGQSLKKKKKAEQMFGLIFYVRKETSEPL
ncbi:hypothetical protein APR43_19260 [Flavobacterium sp. NLM]|nr:hypothetical protein AKO67_22135 [Flavobacterium sp. VMW]OWU89333.1 hypothetical protein APR43_19260 [Flavobacterium sp. NLM]